MAQHFYNTINILFKEKTLFLRKIRPFENKSLNYSFLSLPNDTPPSVVKVTPVTIILFFFDICKVFFY